MHAVKSTFSVFCNSHQTQTYIVTAQQCISQTKARVTRVQIYTNTLLNWQAVDDTGGRQVKTILYVTNSSVDHQLTSFARSHGWLVFDAPQLSSIGVPYLKQMYSHAYQRVTNCTFYGYSNGDILYNRDLLATLYAVSKVTGTLFLTSFGM